MAVSWFEGLLGAVQSGGTSIEIGSGVNFISPLSASLNPLTNMIDVTGLANFDPPLLGEDFRIDVPNLKDTLGIALLCTNITPANGTDQIQRSPTVGFVGSIWDGATSQFNNAGWYQTGVAGNPITSRTALFVSSAGVTVDPMVAFDYNNTTGQAIVWGKTKAVTWKQLALTSAGNAFDFTFNAQAPNSGDGAGFQWICTNGQGTTKAGGSFKIDLGLCTSGGVQGFYRVRLNSNPGIWVGSTGFGANASIYAGTETPFGEQAGSVIALDAAGGLGTTPGGLVSWCHGGAIAMLALAKTGGTRASPTAVGSAEFLGAIVPWGYDGAAMVTGACIFFQSDGTVSSGSVPTKIVFATGTSGNGTVRGTLSNTGAQTWVAAAGAAMSWTISPNPASLYLSSGGAVYSGDSTTLSEDAGSIVSIATSTGTRGITAYQHSNGVQGASFNAFKSHGTRSAPTIVASGDALGEFNVKGYLDGATSAYVSRARLRFAVDGTPSGATGACPTSAQIDTGSTGLTTRTLWSSAGTQTHTIDAGGNASWTVGTIVAAILSAPSGTATFLSFDGTVPCTVQTATMATSGTAGATFTAKGAVHTGTSSGGNTGGAAVFQGGAATGSSTNTHTGGPFQANGGDCTNAGAAGTFTGGATLVRGGDVTGASGTRNGGNVTIRPGTGGTANGSLNLQEGGGANKIQINSTGVGFFAATPVAQPSTTGETVGFTSGVGTAVKDDSTFTGNVGTKAYRLSDIVKHLKNLGLIAAS